MGAGADRRAEPDGVGAGGAGDGRLVVIANRKVLDAGRADRAQYLRFLVMAVEAGRAAGFAPVFLVHEGAGDRALAEAANAALAGRAAGPPCEILFSPDPVRTKAIIAAASGVVSSRFHGLVSALSSLTPALAAGWSHKYAELMGAYGLADAVVDIADAAGWENTLAALLARMQDPGARAALARHAAAEREKAAAMWETVFAFLEAPAPGAQAPR